MPMPMSTQRATFRPHERINDPGDFRRAFERKRSASDAALIVYAVENGRDHPRLGISIGRKKVRQAVERNRIKRLLREAFRLGKAELPPGVDLVVVPRGPGLTFAAARQALPRLAQAAARRLGTKPAIPKANANTQAKAVP
jgi:ribonuclease P protein component